MTHPSSSFSVSRLRELLAEAVECLDHQTSDGQSPSVSGSPSLTQPHADPRRLPEIERRQTSDRQTPSASGSSLPRLHVDPRRPPITARSRPHVDLRRPPDSALIERSCLFNYKRKRYSGKGKSVYSGPSKKKKLNTWVHDFVCLSRTDQERTPDAMERAALISAGLGSKRLMFLQSADAEETHEVIMEAFPKLREAGGYEIMRSSQSRVLEVVPNPADGYTTAYLKDIFGQAKVYIRPVQRDLTDSDNGSLVSNSAGPKDKCFRCGSEIALADMRSHLETCDSVSEDESDGGVDDNVDNDNDHFHFPVVSVVKPGQGNKGTKEVSDETNGTVIDPGPGKEEAKKDSPKINTTVIDLVSPGPRQEDTSTDETSNTADSPVLFSSLEEVISHLQQFLKREIVEFQVRREFVYSDLLNEMKKAKFDPLKRVHTWFIGETGRDTGGITRELWRYFGESLLRLCVGEPPKVLFRHDSERVISGEFKKIGILTGMSLVNGGSGFPFFAPAMYQYVCGKDISSIEIGLDEIPDPQLCHALAKLLDPGDADIQEIAMEFCDVLVDNGCSACLAHLKQSEVPQLVKTASVSCAILKIKAELDQFMLGLNEAGVLHVIQKYPDLFRPLFVKPQEIVLSADYILDLFAKKVFSEAGSIALTNEQATYIFFRDILFEAEEGVLDITLGDVLSYFTGACHPPPLGFPDATLNFNPTNPYPTASTCSLCLTLPTKYESYNTFKKAFILALQSHGGFGLY